MTYWGCVGVVSFLCSHAKAVSGRSDCLQDAATAKEIVSFVKGGVTQNDSLSDQCMTGGVRSSVLLDKDKENSCGSLGLYDGKLCEMGGSADDPVCFAIYPDAGEICRSTSEKLGKNVYYGTVANNGVGDVNDNGVPKGGNGRGKRETGWHLGPDLEQLGIII